jgi:hypothetical protein
MVTGRGVVRLRHLAIASSIGTIFLIAYLLAPVTAEGVSQSDRGEAKLGPMGQSIYGEVHFIWVDCQAGQPLSWAWSSDRPVDFALYTPDGQLRYQALNVRTASGGEMTGTSGKYQMSWLNRSPTREATVAFTVGYFSPGKAERRSDQVVDWYRGLDWASKAQALIVVFVALLVLLGVVVTMAVRMGALPRVGQRAQERRDLTALTCAYVTMDHVGGPDSSAHFGARESSEDGDDTDARGGAGTGR